MQGVVGARLRKARTALGLSQAAFARALGFSSEFISLLEADKRAPSLATLNKIAAYLKKDLRDFLQEKEGAFNILLRGDALKAPGSEGLDPASQAVLERFKRYCDDYLRIERRANQWFQSCKARFRGLNGLGVDPKQAATTAVSRRGPWAMSNMKAFKLAMPNKFFADRGLLALSGYGS